MMMCYLGDLVIIQVGDLLGIIQGIIPIMFPSDSVFETRFSHKTMHFFWYIRRFQTHPNPSIHCSLVTHRLAPHFRCRTPSPFSSSGSRNLGLGRSRTTGIAAAWPRGNLVTRYVGLGTGVAMGHGSVHAASSPRSLLAQSQVRKSQGNLGSLEDEHKAPVEYGGSVSFGSRNKLNIIKIKMYYD